MSKDREEHAVVVRDLHKSYRLGHVKLDVLRGVDFAVRSGEFVAVEGQSGSGKSTLLHLLGLLDRPDNGTVLLEGQDAAKLSRRRRNRIRCRDVGFVFQFYHLLPELTVLENVLMPAMIDATALGWRRRRAKVRTRAAQLLETVGLSERVRHRPRELSGGERQRVAIARALMNAPKLLLADEPTGNLDSGTGRSVMNVLHRCNREENQTIVMVTHDVQLAREADRYAVLQDGRMSG